ncbi:MAG TPA: thiol:disulfide interchange protein DsbG [Pseudomonas xinjiangensis]|uniref:Thiol:disulfide interchange protein n=2 Tax=root TaxID=1 RepID=A0A7V1FS97_9GAMM|nr:thiol:disulfide interchange protein DsbG [Halopseudomonas xinjiangensis]HEC46243.1 thiol:disulfide interchange protein DsbG [Halopseudomonas xinjiangensis]
MIKIYPMSALCCALSLFPASHAIGEQWPAAIEAVQSKGVQIVDAFDAPSGLQGYAARFNGQGLALYLTEDGEHVLVGNLLDAQGENLSQEPLERLVYEPLGKEMWQRLEQSSWIADGSDDAARIVYMFSDPNCPYCNMFWKQARPWVESGTVQVRHVMVGMLMPDSAGKAAALLVAKDPEAALNVHEEAGKASQLKPIERISPTVNQRLEANLTLMSEMGASATPAIYYLDDDGRLQQHQGAPRPDALNEIMGPLSKG